MSVARRKREGLFRCGGGNVLRGVVETGEYEERSLLRRSLVFLPTLSFALLASNLTAGNVGIYATCMRTA
ncbi:hypothetical protein KC327_g50 [Hortaea werneckii]|nr:hypothetical protein KC327_g50 [Hortaea werneckii]